MKLDWRRAGALGIFLLLLGVAAKAETPDPAVAQVQKFYDSLLGCMKQAKELGVKGRYEKLKPVIEQVFDIPDMTRLVVGPSWASTPLAEQQALQIAFERYTAAQYASNFDAYDGEKFEVEPTTQPRGADRVVITKLVTRKQTYPFYYIMRDVGGTWKVVNVLQNGTISTLAVQRSDFGSTLSASGAPGLVKKLNSLSDKLLAGG